MLNTGFKVLVMWHVNNKIEVKLEWAEIFDKYCWK